MSTILSEEWLAGSLSPCLLFTACIAHATSSLKIVWDNVHASKAALQRLPSNSLFLFQCSVVSCLHPTIRYPQRITPSTKSNFVYTLLRMLHARELGLSESLHIVGGWIMGVWIQKICSAWFSHSDLGAVRVAYLKR
jgi:hypothetical protein